MRENYDPAAVERVAQGRWDRQSASQVREDAARPKFYACSMLPYPSGRLHMGHVRNYTINDVMARYMRMRGYNVLMPMGWDAFGLPAENAAIEKKIAPAQWTRGNIKEMKAQMRPLGLSIDWSREIATCDVDYYRWNQWFFLKMLEHGIAYRKTQTVNWDPVDHTVLANEQVIDGRGWRSGAPVEKREIPGYYLRTSQYADELLDSVLHDLEGWPARVRLMQENWIGRSVGVNVGFPYELDGEHKLLRVFTTRADTIMGVTFVAVAAEHPLAQHFARANPQICAFIEECQRRSFSEAELATAEKKGIATGFFVKHPLTSEPIEVWVANYVLMGYGEGAVMGVPAEDERDRVFAAKYGLAVKPIGEHSVDAVAAELKARKLGDKQTTYRLRDWGISRQRYWGTPIPIIHCEACGPVPVRYADLPVILPEDLVPDGTGNPLDKDERFLKCECPQCKRPARRETDTMDTFVDSAWYYMRYCSPDARAAMVDARIDYWMPMDQYIGGIEHAVLHLLYARFWTKVMRDLGLVKFGEPFTRLFTQGMLLAECFYREEATGKRRWFYPGELEIRGPHTVARADGLAVTSGGIEKMSKSKNNIVEPAEIIERFGADTARAYVMFAGPPVESAVWSDSGAEGVHRFLRRLWMFAVKHADGIKDCYRDGQGGGAVAAAEQALRREIHLNLKQACFDYERLQYNTVVSAAMKMLNALEGAGLNAGSALRESMSILLRTLYPIAPHITDALWTELEFAREHGELLDAPWPQPDPAALRQDEIELVVQVNGKLRGSIRVPAAADRSMIEAAALGDTHVQKFIAGQPVKKTVVVPGKLVNLVV